MCDGSGSRWTSGKGIRLASPLWWRSVLNPSSVELLTSQNPVVSLVCLLNVSAEIQTTHILSSEAFYNVTFFLVFHLFVFCFVSLKLRNHTELIMFALYAYQSDFTLFHSKKKKNIQKKKGETKRKTKLFVTAYHYRFINTHTVTLWDSWILVRFMRLHGNPSWLEAMSLQLNNSPSDQPASCEEVLAAQ